MLQLMNENYLMPRVMMGVLVIGALGVGAGYYKRISIYRFTTITEGQVYKSGAMSPEALKEKIKEYGIRAVIDFRSPRKNVDEENAFLTQLNVKHFNLPSGQIPENEVVESFLAIMDHPEYRPILLHCKHGIGRAVLFSAIYRMEYESWINEHARRAAYWESTLSSSFKPNEEKGIFIREYIPRKRRATTLSFNAISQ